MGIGKEYLMLGAAVAKNGVNQLSQVKQLDTNTNSRLSQVQPSNDPVYSKLFVSQGGGTMRSLNPFRQFPKLTSAIGLLFTAGVATGAGMLIRDALGSQEWCNTMKDGFIHVGGEIKHFFTEGAGQVLSSAPAIATYLGVAGFISTVYNLATFSKGIRANGATPGEQAVRGVKTLLSGAAAGAAFGAMAGHLGAGAGMGYGAIIGVSVGAGIGLVQAIIMLINSRSHSTLHA